MSWMQTYLGKRYWPLDPKPGDVFIEDIAHALAMQCRFNGHSSSHYSVAQHSVLVSNVLPDNLKLQGLLHDAAEAYLGDVIKPIKWDEFKKIEDRNLKVIFERFGVDWPLHPDVHVADLALLATEARDIMGGERHPWNIPTSPLDMKIEPWDSFMSEQRFLNCFVGFVEKK